MARRRAIVTGFPKSRRLIFSFWQNTQPREQPEKKMVPEPLVPEIGGSSHMCRAARATTGTPGIRQRPSPAVSVRRAPHWRGQRLQRMGFTSFA